MSRAFLGFGQAPYIGQPSPQPIKLGGISGRIIPLLFQWLSYGAASSKPNINVLVSIDNFANKSFDQIRSVYIDNLGSSVPVYVFFPDTGYTISAKANSEGWYPAFTNARQFWVIGEGFLDGSIPQTYVILSNIPFQASVNTELDQAASLWLASPSISRGNSIYNSRLGIPALGDQLTSAFVLTSAASTAALWNTPYPSGFVYVTSLVATAFAFIAAGAGVGSVVIESTGIGGTLMTIQFVAVVVPLNSELLSLTGMQLKLDATQTWRLRTNVAVGTGGQLILNSSYTQQP
jgi:hypothetical protein